MAYFLGHHKLLRLWLFLAAAFVLLAFVVNLITVTIFGKTTSWYVALYNLFNYFLFST